VASPLGAGVAGSACVSVAGTAGVVAGVPGTGVTAGWGVSAGVVLAGVGVVAGTGRAVVLVV
jgi:hypothetical protein